MGQAPNILQVHTDTCSDGMPLLGYGTTVTLNATDAQGTTVRAALIRLGSTTHGNDMDQRYLYLDTTATPPSPGGVTTLNAIIPVDPAAAPPGDYQLVLVRDGVPSIGIIVRVQRA